MSLTRFFSHEAQRRYLFNKVKDGTFKDYLASPLPAKKLKVKDTEFLALDFETTGLNPQTEAILSVGYTVIKNMRVLCRENGHHIIKINKPVPPQSVTIHKITDDRVSAGEHIHNVMALLLSKIKGRVLLVHYAPIEREFINAASQQIYGFKLPMTVVDTMKIEKKRLINKNMLVGPSHLRLFNIRQRHGLPRYYAHSALEDAIATAELFLAQNAQMGEGLRIRNFL